MTVPSSPGGVSLVIPGRNATHTLRPCLDAVMPLLERGELGEVIFVDDGSTDATPEVARAYPVRYVKGEGKGPGYARNLGWRAARGALVWFIDSDCVVEPNALERLLPHLADPGVGGAGGTYGNMCPDRLLPCLIHEEIVERHRCMPEDVDYLASFNVVYRREALERSGGFDEASCNGPNSPGAEDIELAFRLHEMGWQLKFEHSSCVKHYHPTRLGRYLRSQRHHGYWRVWLYLLHFRKARGDSYSGVLDHVQPPLALAVAATLPLLAWPPLWAVPLGLAFCLLLTQLPMTVRLVRRLRSGSYLWFAPLGMVRALWRGVGMASAACEALVRALCGHWSAGDVPPVPRSAASQSVSRQP